MANTYTLIASNTLSSTAASVTFSSIPATYSDLVLKCSVRTGNSGTSLLYLEFNNNTSSIYSWTYVRGDGSVASSANSGANATQISAGSVNTGTSNTANTFGSTEIYIPSYTASQNKPVSTFGASENNAASTNAVISANAGLFRSTSAISSIKLTESLGGNFVSGSSFFLYGIKNS